VYILYAFFGTTILHNVYFGGRLLRTRESCRLDKAWPYTRAFSGYMMRMLYPSTMMFLSMSSAALAISGVIAQGGFTLLIDTTSAAITVVLWTLQIIILGGGTFQAIQSLNTEDRAQCAKEGHAWKRFRMQCSALPEPIAVDVKEVRTLVRDIDRRLIDIVQNIEKA
jgi:hypothetical protein